MENDTLLKAISTKRYKVELFQTPSDLFVVKHTTPKAEERYSEGVKDYNMASYLFDLKVEELEGN